MENVIKNPKYVFNSTQVVGFSPTGYENAFVSRLLIDQDNVGSQRLVMNLFSLKPGKKTDPGSHPSPFDEIYYVLKGKGILHLGETQEAFEVGPNTVVFIPHDTLHFVINPGEIDLDMITIMPGPIEPGANFVYDQRKQKWGKSFLLVEPNQEEEKNEDY